MFLKVNEEKQRKEEILYNAYRQAAVIKVTEAVTFGKRTLRCPVTGGCSIQCPRKAVKVITMYLEEGKAWLVMAPSAGGFSSIKWHASFLLPSFPPPRTLY